MIWKSTTLLHVCVHDHIKLPAGGQGGQTTRSSTMNWIATIHWCAYRLIYFHCKIYLWLFSYSKLLQCHFHWRGVLKWINGLCIHFTEESWFAEVRFSPIMDNSICISTYGVWYNSRTAYFKVERFDSVWFHGDFFQRHRTSLIKDDSIPQYKWSKNNLIRFDTLTSFK